MDYDYLYDKLLKAESEIRSLSSTLERLEKIESTLRTQDSVLTFIVGFLLTNEIGKREACKTMIKKWYYGAKRSKRVSLAQSHIEDMKLKDLDTDMRKELT
jgi:hypothetical protein